MVKKGVWTSNDAKRTMTVSYAGSNFVDVEEHNNITNISQQLKVGLKEYNQFQDYLVAGGWTYNDKPLKRRIK
jgi:hypothetical protein